MCYDMYSPNPYPYHALFDDSITVMQKWSDSGFPKSKLLMGIPFYARDNYKLWIPYDQIVDQFNPSNSQNSVSVSTFMGKKVSGGVLWWGSIELDTQKSDWIKANNYGGVMLYSLGTDKLQSSKSKLLNIYLDFHPESQSQILPPTPTSTNTVTESNDPNPIPHPIPNPEITNSLLGPSPVISSLIILIIIGFIAFCISFAIFYHRTGKHRKPKDK
jgi:GH18 family chitinase